MLYRCSTWLQLLHMQTCEERKTREEGWHRRGGGEGGEGGGGVRERAGMVT